MRLYNSTGLRNARQPHIFFCHRIIPRFSFSAHLPLCNHTAFFDDAQVLNGIALQERCGTSIKPSAISGTAASVML